MACSEQLSPLEKLGLLQSLFIWPQQPWLLAWLQPLPLPFSQSSLIFQAQTWLEALLLLLPLSFIELYLFIWLGPSHFSSLLLLQALRLLLFEEWMILKSYPQEKIWLAYHSSQQLYRSSFQVLLSLIFHFFKPSFQSSLQLPTQVRIQPSHSSHLLLRFSSHSLAWVLLWWICPSYRLLSPPSFGLLQPSLLIFLTFYLYLARLQPCHYLPSSDFLSQVWPIPSFQPIFPQPFPSDLFPSSLNFFPSLHSSSPHSFPPSSHCSFPPQHPLPSFSRFCLPFPLLTQKQTPILPKLGADCCPLSLDLLLYSQNRQGKW